MASAKRRVILSATAAACLAGLAAAQSSSPYPYVVTPSYATPGASSDSQNVEAALAAGKRGDGVRARAAMNAIYDPIARKIALWALIDGAPTEVTFSEADSARRTLAGWPREDRRAEAAEALLGQSGLPSAQVVAWFDGQQPRTGPGALALGIALNATGQPAAAGDVIRKVWRTLVFDQATQDAMLASFSGVLTADDYIAREDLLLYGGDNAQAQDLLRFLPPDQQALAQARMAYRRGDPNAASLVAALPMAEQNSPGLIYERVLSLRDHGDDAGARQLMSALPADLPLQSAAERLWKHGTLVSDALRAGDYTGAYTAAAHSGLTVGPAAAEAQFYAGWIALTHMKDPRLADGHFARVAAAGASPLTQSRAYYWRGRAAEAEEDPVDAQLYFGQAARYYTTFYGQLAAERSGVTTLILGHDPQITSADRSEFEARDFIKAMRYLAGIGAKDDFRLFAADLADILPTGADAAMLTDVARAYGDQSIAMRVVRNAARRDLILPERGYPLASTPLGYGFPEPAFVLGIARQESSFDPQARSGAGARGMMQLMPGTAAGLARRLGQSYSAGDLDDPVYNMRLGAYYLGQLVDQFSGSYVMAAAAYNAGPGRPTQWTAACGDPRSGDPLNFIECIPFSETRDYVMRVMEATQVYRARLHGGEAPLTLANDLRRGSYGYHVPP